MFCSLSIVRIALCSFHLFSLPLPPAKFQLTKSNFSLLKRNSATKKYTLLLIEFWFYDIFFALLNLSFKVFSVVETEPFFLDYLVRHRSRFATKSFVRPSIMKIKIALSSLHLFSLSSLRLEEKNFSSQKA
jgi:hypothetical protein